MKFCYILLIGLFVVVFSNAQTTTYMNPSYEYISKQTSLPSKIPLNPPIAEKTITTTMKTVFITTTKTASATLLPLPDDINYCKDNNTCDIIYIRDKYGEWSIENAKWCFCGRDTRTFTKALPVYTTTATSTKTIPTSTTTATSTKTIPTSTTTATSTKTIPTSTTTATSTKTIPTSTTTATSTKTIPTISTSDFNCLPITITVTKKVTVTEKVTVTINSSEPTSQSQENCVKKWAQCGGIGYSGPTCCEQGTTCHEYNQFYSQCI